MKGSPAKVFVKAFTLVELLLVIFIIVVLAAMLLPVDGGSRKASQAVCLSNLKQAGTSLIIWADDHNGGFPWQVSVTNGGTIESVPSGRVSPHFQVLSNFLKQPQRLHCPTDRSKLAAPSFAALTDQNVSYFVSFGAPTNNPAYSILAGDRHLETNGQPVKPGLFTVTSNLTVGWTRELHPRSGNMPAGSMGFADGHVEIVKTDRLTAVFQRQGLATNRLAVP